EGWRNDCGLVAAAQCRNSTPRRLRRRRIMNHAHKSYPYDPNSHHWRISFCFNKLRVCTVFLLCPFFTTFTEFLAHFLALSTLEPDAFEGWSPPPFSLLGADRRATARPPSQAA